MDNLNIQMNKLRESIKTERDGYKEIIYNMNIDICFLISNWFISLEDEGIDPWENSQCIMFAEKYKYTKENYKLFKSRLC